MYYFCSTHHTGTKVPPVQALPASRGSTARLMMEPNCHSLRSLLPQTELGAEEEEPTANGEKPHVLGCGRRICLSEMRLGSISEQPAATWEQTPWDQTPPPVGMGHSKGGLQISKTCPDKASLPWASTVLLQGEGWTSDFQRASCQQHSCVAHVRLRLAKRGQHPKDYQAPEPWQT